MGYWTIYKRLRKFGFERLRIIYLCKNIVVSNLSGKADFKNQKIGTYINKIKCFGF